MTSFLPTKRLKFTKLKFERVQKLWKDVKDDTVKYE